MSNLIDTVITTEATRVNVKAMLPVLINWAKNGETKHTYEDLANSVGKNRGQWVGYVLGSIQDVIDALSEKSNRTIPTLNALVNRKDTGLPSEGFEYVSKEYNGFPIADKRIYVDGLNKRACDYEHWDWVLSQLNLTSYKPFSELDMAEILKEGTHAGGGEGKEHRKIKEYVATHPEVVGLCDVINAEMEYPLPSGDSLDELFSTKNGDLVAVEVKPSTSDDADITRGIFQCVKYMAVLNAMNKLKGHNGQCSVILLTNRPVFSRHQHLIRTLSVRHKQFSFKL